MDTEKGLVADDITLSPDMVALGSRLHDLYRQNCVFNAGWGAEPGPPWEELSEAQQLCWCATYQDIEVEVMLGLGLLKDPTEKRRARVAAQTGAGR